MYACYSLIAFCVKLNNDIRNSSLPDGVFQIINGTVNAVTSLCNHNDIKAVTFVGSSKVAKIVHNDQNDPALNGTYLAQERNILY